MRTALVASTLLTLATLASTASALDWIEPPRDRTFAGSPSDAALAFLRTRPSLDAIELRVRTLLPSTVGTTVRLEQRWQGLPVIGAEAAVRVSADGHITAATSALHPRLALPASGPSLTAADVVALVASEGRVPTSAVRMPRLAVLPDGEAPGGGWLTWELDAATGGLGGEHWVIDAQSGEVRLRQGLAREVKGRVYAVNSLDTPDPTDVDLLDLDPVSPGWLTGFAGQLSVYQYVSGGSSAFGGGYVAQPSVGPNSGEDYLYDPPSSKTDKTDEFAAVNSYYHIHRVREFYTKTIGLDMSASAWQLAVVANTLESGKLLNNAFYSPYGLSDPGVPNMVAIGQGFVDFAYDSSVFIHEFSHYISSNAVGYNQGQFGVDKYGHSPASGSIDEGIADFYACTINGDPILGKVALGAYSRDLSQTDKVCPEGLTGEIHEDGKIIGSVSWAIRGVLGEQLADQLVWGGFSLLIKGTSLQDFATGVLTTADAMVTAGQLTADQRAAVAQEFTKRSLDDCGRVLSLNKNGRGVSLMGLDAVGQYFGGSCGTLYKNSMSAGFQFSYRPEPGAKRVRFSVALTPTGYSSSNMLDWGIYLTKNRDVPFTSSGSFPRVGQVDARITDIYDSVGELAIGEGTDTPLDLDATYTIALVHKNCPSAQAYVEAISDLEIPPPTGGSGGASGSAGAAGSRAGSGGHAGKSPINGKAGNAGAAARAGSAGAAGAAPELADDSLDTGGGCQASHAPPSRIGLGLLLALGALARRRTPRASQRP